MHNQHRPRHTFTRVTYRFLSGRPIDGYRRTDGGYFRKGQNPAPGIPYASPWARLPGWKRQAVRVGTPSATGIVTYGTYVHPWWTLTVCSLIVSGVGFVAVRKLIRVVRNWRFDRHVRQPLISAVAGFADLPTHVVGNRLVLSDTEVRIPLADHHSGQAAPLADIKRIVTQRIGGEWDAKPNFRIHPFYLHLTPVPSPPAFVSVSDVIDAIHKTSQDKPVLGLGTRGEVIHLDFTGEIAHLAASIGTGGGKSSFLRLLIGQFAYHGVRDFEVVDVKQVSLEGMEGVPGLRYHRHVEECWEALARIRAEMDARYAIRLKNPTKVFPRKIVLMEEQNAFAELTRMAWKAQGGKGLAPVWGDITLLLTMARQVNIIVVGMYQRMSARVSGGGELRDQYGLKVLSRFSPQAWDSLVGTRPRGKSSSIPGRAIAIMGDSHRIVQLPFAEPAEALALALSGTPVTVTSSENQQARVCVTPTVTLRDRRFSLVEAAQQEWCAASYDNLRQRASRAKRAGKVPSDATTYTQDEITNLIGVN